MTSRRCVVAPIGREESIGPFCGLEARFGFMPISNVSEVNSRNSPYGFSEVSFAAERLLLLAT